MFQMPEVDESYCSEATAAGANYRCKPEHALRHRLVLIIARAAHDNLDADP
jgi:hypothetical protein